MRPNCDETWHRNKTNTLTLEDLNESTSHYTLEHYFHSYPALEFCHLERYCSQITEACTST